MQRSRNRDSMQGFMSSFKLFEKKLDKLQDDVNFHGNTLNELRTLVANLAAGINTEAKKSEELKRPQRKTVALQYDLAKRLRRPMAVQPPHEPNKLKVKSYQDQKYGLEKVSIEPNFRKPKGVSMPLMNKHQRLKKAEAPRKAITLLRTQKSVPKKRSKSYK